MPWRAYSSAAVFVSPTTACFDAASGFGALLASELAAMGARLQRHDRGRAACAFACSGEGIHLGMRSAATAMESLGDDFPARIDDHAPDHRIRLRAAMPARGEAHCAAEQRPDL
jgi:hypothetical protein